MEGIEDKESYCDYDFISVSEVVSQSLNIKIDNIVRSSDDTKKEAKSGFKDLDNIITKFDVGQLITISVRPGKGKTSFLLSLLYNLTEKSNLRIAVFSPERSSSKLVQRLIESETGNSAEKIYTGLIKESEKEKINKIIDNLINSTIIIDDSTTLTNEEIEKRCFYLKNSKKVDIIIFDHFELYSKNILDSESNYEEQEKLLINLEQITKKLNIPIIAFSQITNTHNLTHPNSKPDLTNVFDFVKNLSDVIMFLHRPNVLNFDKPEFIEWKGCAEIIIVKHPNISTPQSVKLKFIESSDKFADF